MDIKALDKDIISIIEKKNKLSGLKYDDKTYDLVEDELHMLEDNFMDKYGDYFEEVLENVHNDLSPDTDVLAAIAYFAPKYIVTGKGGDGTPIYDVNPKDGVYVEVEKYEGKDTRLVLVPSPARFVLVVDEKNKEVVWQAK